MGPGRIREEQVAKRVVWGAGTPRTLRPHWVLHELGLPYETRAIAPRTPGMEDPAFLAAFLGPVFWELAWLSYIPLLMLLGRRRRRLGHSRSND